VAFIFFQNNNFNKKRKENRTFTELKNFNVISLIKFLNVIFENKKNENEKEYIFLRKIS